MCFLFMPEDKVLLQHIVPSKMTLKVKGPYLLVHYMDPLQVTARSSLDGAGETRTISAANLPPINPKEPALLEAMESDEEDWVDEITNISNSGTPVCCWGQEPWR